MSYSEIIFKVIPLFIVVLFSLIYECKTGHILNVINYPSLLYFLSISLYLDKNTFLYCIAGAVILFFISFIIFTKGALGPGAVKLLTVIGAAIGLKMSIQFCITLILINIPIYFIFKAIGRKNAITVRSTTIIFPLLLILYIFNYGILFFLPK
ncbi:MAG: prepilin peptidase [Candidatus Aureabacteria bacterium]|nr:prepilin peptidase [Candidatus Auribacterota bacterium]